MIGNKDTYTEVLQILTDLKPGESARYDGLTITRHEDGMASYISGPGADLIESAAGGLQAVAEFASERHHVSAQRMLFEGAPA